MKDSLLIGNGLNRCLEGGVSWGNLLDGLTQEYGVAYNPGISMPLEYERIVNVALSKMKSPSKDFYDETKRYVVDAIGDPLLPEEAIHRKIAALAPGAVFTTNYDFLIEQAFNSAYTASDARHHNSTKYLMNPTATLFGTDFYHIHGDVKKEATICLGYEHYMGLLNRLRTNINTNKGAGKHRIQKAILQKLAEGDALVEWGDRFYADNIGILGLALDENEFDLWWLLTHRASLYYANIEGGRKLIKNEIVYFDVLNDIGERTPQLLAEIKRQQNKWEMLKGAHVTVRLYPLSEYGSYPKAYNGILDDIARNNGVLGLGTKKAATAQLL